MQGEVRGTNDKTTRYIMTSFGGNLEDAGHRQDLGAHVPAGLVDHDKERLSAGNNVLELPAPGQGQCHPHRQPTRF
jgi:hypothetical protein